MTEKEYRILAIENRLKKLNIKPMENKRLINKWLRIKRRAEQEVA